MRVVGGLCTCIVACAWMVTANVEKTIFVAPRPVELHEHAQLPDFFHLAALSPTSPVLETRLPVQFPTTTAPRGLEYWYILQGLEQGRRYEVRICWPATSPTDFWLDTFDPIEVIDSAQLYASITQFGVEGHGHPLEYSEPSHRPNSPSALVLRIQAAASFYSTHLELMEYPPDVDVDIILDPYILNILPRSLVPIAIYISFAAVGAWFLSGLIYGWLRAVAAETESKPHID